MKILVSGAGIAGLVTAYWLHEYGYEVNVVEKAPQMERNGYLIGFRGPSITVLRRMGVLENTLERGSDSFHYDILNSKGRPINRSRYLSYKEDERGKLPINRADLCTVLYEAVKDKVGIRFGATIESVYQHSHGVDVHLSDGRQAAYDLLIGADGVHSNVRQQVFGSGFEQVLNATYASFISPKTDPVASTVQFARGRMSIVYDLSATEFGSLFVFKGHDFSDVPVNARKTALIERHDAPIADALRCMPNDTYIFVDKLSQVVMPRWFEGRVALVGDAAYCLSPASGFGATAAIAGGYILAEEIARHGLDGLAMYDRRMRRPIEKKQKSAARIVNQLVTENPLMVAIRDVLLRLMPEKASHKTKAVDDFGIGATSGVPSAA